jgi:hypothetical protein
MMAKSTALGAQRVSVDRRLTRSGSFFGGACDMWRACCGQQLLLEPADFQTLQIPGCVVTNFLGMVSWIRGYAVLPLHMYAAWFTATRV